MGGHGFLDSLGAFDSLEVPAHSLPSWRNIQTDSAKTAIETMLKGGLDASSIQFWEQSLERTTSVYQQASDQTSYLYQLADLGSKELEELMIENRGRFRAWFSR